jgi:Tfp pilus assembly protein PilO
MNTATKKITVILLLVALSITVGSFVLLKSVRDKNAHIIALSTELADAMQKDSQKNTVRDVVRNTQTQRQELDSFFVQKDAVVDSITAIENLASGSGNQVEISNVNLDAIPGDDASTIESLRINVVVKGPWNAVYHFLPLLEALPYKITITKIHLAVQKESIWEGDFDLSILKLK